MKLTGEELVQVIKACKEAKATRFKAGGVEVCFSPNGLEEDTEALDKAYFIKPIQTKEDTASTPPLIEEDDMLAVTDPDAWEEAQLKEI